MSLQSPTVVLVGTSHTLQLGLGTPASADRLAVFLSETSRTHNVRHIAEEMNADALAEKDVFRSIPMVVAKKLGLSHCFCDPTPDERKRLGIVQENDVRAGFLFKTAPPEEIEARVRAEYDKRENVWFARLRDYDQWPALFVCGSNHVQTFGQVLAANGIIVSVAAEDWDDQQ